MKSKGLKGVTVQLTNSDITQTDMLTLSGESAKECVTRTRVTRLSSKTCRVAKYSLDPQGHTGEKRQTFLACVHPELDPVIHYNTLLYIIICIMDVTSL